MSRRADAAIAATFATILAALVPATLAVGAGYYSAVRQCNQDASDLETQLTSILLEVADREARMKLLLATDKVPVETLRPELGLIENGADGHYGDPAFKDHSLVSLVNQYNRLLRRVTFPPACAQDQTAKCVPVTDLGIDTRQLHPAIETVDITKAEARGFGPNVDQDLALVDKQQAWHKFYGPVRLCSIVTLLHGSEPWKLIKLVPRPE
jgi:hypothetical protein